MHIVEKENGVLVEFGNKLNSRIKILFSFEAMGGLLTVIFCLVGMFYSLIDSHSEAILTFFLFVGAILGAIFFWRYIKRTFRKESLFISKDAITIINSIFSRKEERPYGISNISHFNYKGKASKTDHPLKGKSYDYLGFETQELVIAEVHNEGNLSFFYEGRTIYFGRNVYSWDSEELNKILFRVTHGNLQIGNLEISADRAEYIV